MIKINNEEAREIIDVYDSFFAEYGTIKCNEPLYLRLKEESKGK